MAAIDLLLHSKKDSERLHQLVLAALLGRTHLLARLVPLPGAARPDLAGLLWEPEGKTFDFAVPIVVNEASGPADSPAGSAGARIGRVLIELRVDAALDEDQLEKQLNPRHFHPGDQLLYLLLGYSEITLHRGMLAQVLARIARRDRAPDLRGRVSVRGASDLIPLLADPDVLPDGPERRDARDLLSAYRDLLGELRGRVTRFAGQPLSQWSEGDYYGLFARCRAERLASMADAEIGRAAGAEAGVSGCQWLPLPIPGGELSLQFEDDRLCIKLRPTQESQRKRVRDQVDAALHSLGVAPATEAEVPGRLVAAPRRLGSLMTVAYVDGLLADLRPGLGALGAALHTLEELVRATARALTTTTTEPAAG
jgi:hypothetical protein